MWKPPTRTIPADAGRGGHAIILSHPGLRVPLLRKGSGAARPAHREEQEAAATGTAPVAETRDPAEEMDTARQMEVEPKTLVHRSLAQETLADEMLRQGLTSLTDAVKVGLHAGLYGTAGDAALEVVECLGQSAPNTAARYLAVYQSCVSSQYLIDLFSKAAGPADLFVEAALLKRGLDRPVQQPLDAEAAADQEARQRECEPAVPTYLRT